MPFATNRGQKIHYTLDGAGPLVVLQHGLLMDAESWRANGFVEALVQGGYRVACVDSLGHGLSDKPADPALYAQSQRAGDIVAVLDDLGEARAHLVGYSMGGWISVGVAKHHPDRLASLVVGGWDLLAGPPLTPMGPLSFDVFMQYANAMAPQLTAWVTPQVTPCLRACFEALTDVEGAGTAVLGLDVPVLLWNGDQDVYHAPMQAFAAANGLPFVTGPGEHIPAIERPGGEAIAAVRAFIQAA